MVAAGLRGGGLWLLAAEDYRDYGPERVAAVFRVLAPVLRRGRPARLDGSVDIRPQRIVFQDAGE